LSHCCECLVIQNETLWKIVKTVSVWKHEKVTQGQMKWIQWLFWYWYLVCWPKITVLKVVCGKAHCCDAKFSSWSYLHTHECTAVNPEILSRMLDSLFWRNIFIICMDKSIVIFASCLLTNFALKFCKCHCHFFSFDRNFNADYFLRFCHSSFWQISKTLCEWKMYCRCKTKLNSNGCLTQNCWTV